jgi:hypothetical protein
VIGARHFPQQNAKDVRRLQMACRRAADDDRSAIDGERRQCRGIRHAGDGQAGAALEGGHRIACVRTVYAIDVADVEAALLEHGLKVPDAVPARTKGECAHGGLRCRSRRRRKGRGGIERHDLLDDRHGATLLIDHVRVEDPVRHELAARIVR